MVTYFLLKGSPRNVSWSLVDMMRQRTLLLKSKPRNWMLWGVNPRFKWVLRELPGSTIILYVTKSEGVRGGLVLYGTAREPLDLNEPYWPEGTWTKAFYLEIKGIVPSALEEPENPAAWELVPRERIAEAGVMVLPGPQRLSAKQGEALKSLIETLASS